MTYIDKTEFGKIAIDSKLYTEDVKILASGKILKRWGPKGSHTLCAEEFKEMLKEKPAPEVIVIGTGQSGMAELEPEARKEIEARGIKIIAEPTPEAIKSFNKIKQKKAGLFHVTC